ncbi:MAG: DUF2029 domain-containing protein [Chthoniobacterales bacterium]|nr:DUF2029 domain-containing protein [Chthoniobacterales bacterium]
MSKAATLSPPRSWLQRLNTPAAFRALIALFAIVLLVYGGIAVANALLPGKSIKDYELWHDTGQRILHGEQIYPKRNTKFPFMYPPSAALLLAPISALGRTGIVVTLSIVNAAAWLASILLSARLVAGNWRRQPLLLYLIPSALVAVYIWSCFHLGQPSVLLLALMLGAFVALQEKRQILAGSLIALAAAIKAFPVVAILYLLYRRSWMASASLLLALVILLIALPAPFRGFEQARYDLQRWASGMLFKYDDKGLAQRPGRSNSWKNQSLFGLANRMLRHIDADEQYDAHTPIYKNIADLSFTAVNRFILTAGLLLGLAYLAVLPRAAQRTRETDAIEFALLLLLMLMFTPLAFGYLFAWLLYPFAVVVWRSLVQPRRQLLAPTALAVLLLAVTIPLQRTAQMYGNVFFATLVLFLALAWELWRLKKESSTLKSGAHMPPPLLV